MYFNRIIPCLLLQDQGLVKTIKFSKPRYIGDPLNAVKIFNEKEVDELIFLDITATREGRTPNFKYLSQIADKCFMPLCYGGGVKTMEHITTLFRIGFEKVIINSESYLQPNLITQAGSQFGSQSIVGCIDIKKDIFGKYSCFRENGKINTKISPLERAKQLEAYGVGEIMINNIQNDGMRKGYDIKIIHEITNNVKVPVIACGGANCLSDFKQVIAEGGASAAAAGSYFVFWGSNNAVLINYPMQDEIERLFDKEKI